MQEKARAMVAKKMAKKKEQKTALETPPTMESSAPSPLLHLLQHSSNRCCETKSLVKSEWKEKERKIKKKKWK